MKQTDDSRKKKRWKVETKYPLPIRLQHYREPRYYDQAISKKNKNKETVHSTTT